ncbi:hypothetical protein PN437_11065 [Microcystis aeruginosa CS-564/01]|nr:hypothetical protein [Microcystis aeruginosa CS-564/01]
MMIFKFNYQFLTISLFSYQLSVISYQLSDLSFQWTVLSKKY